ncbi:hypothetical protein OAJ84_03495 [Candidatus Puniceispirillum sp.]|nr:hypothetical protein [Candidatus Puniceispirillum sp.]
MYFSSQRSEAYVVRSGNIKISILPEILPVAKTLNALFKCIVICFFLVLSKAHAAEKQIHVFIAPVDEASRLDSLFTREIEGAFIDLGISMTDTRAVIGGLNDKTTLNGQDALFDKLIEHFTIHSSQGIMIDPSLSQIEGQRLMPVLRVIALPSGRLISSTASLDISKDAMRDELRIAAVSIARRALRQMQDNTGDLDWAQSTDWASNEHVLNITIENFTICEQNYILEEMETEFPGFISMDIVSSIQSTYAKYNYRTTAKNQRLTKWIQIFLMEHQMMPGKDFNILYHQKKLRLILENGSKLGTACDAS